MTFRLDTPAATTWPLPGLDQAQRDMSQWAAYWAADERGMFTPNIDPEPVKERGTWLFRRKTDTATVARPRSIVTTPIAGDVAGVAADLLFSDAASLTADDDASDDTKAALDAIADRIALDLHAAADTAAGVGGVWLRPVWDRDRLTRAQLSIIGQDQAIPETVLGVTTAVTFWHELPARDSSDQDVYRHFERHEPGRVFHQLRRGTRTELGPAVPLADRIETAALGDLVDAAGGISLEFAGDLAQRIMPTFVPNRYWQARRARDYGRADFAGCLREIDMLNETMSSWSRDIRLGQARILVAAGLLTSGRFDLDDEVFSELPGLDPSTDKGDPIRPVQFELRVAEHKQTAEHLTEAIVQSSGYAPQTFGIHTEGAISGTAHQLRELRSHRSNGRKQRAWAPAIAHAARWLLALDGAVHGVAGAGQQPETLRVEFAETDADEPLQRAQTVELLQRAEAISRRTAVRMAQPDLTADDLDAEVEAIRSERATSDLLL